MSDEHLEKRIAAALTDDITSDDVAALIAECEAGITEAEASAEAERLRALDPVQSPDAKAAHEAMLAAEFGRDRLRNLLPRLQQRLQEVRASEEFRRWLPEQQAAKTRRDHLASKLRDLYVPFLNAIVPLLLEIEYADQEIIRVNQAAPYKAQNGGYLLESVEHAARGSSALQLRHLQIIKHLRLPNWEGSELPLWPPHRPRDMAAFTPTVGGDPRLHTDRWEEVKKEAPAAAEREARVEMEKQSRSFLATTRGGS